MLCYTCTYTVRKIKIGDSGHVSNDIEVYNTHNTFIYVHFLPLFYYNVRSILSLASASSIFFVRQSSSDASFDSIYNSIAFEISFCVPS
jgi:hypothetical protein